jgi:hypothetical protein
LVSIGHHSAAAPVKSTEMKRRSLTSNYPQAVCAPFLAELKTMNWDGLRRSQRFCYFGEVWRIVWIKTAIPRSLLYRSIGWQQHRDRIANWIIISYPRKCSAWIAYGKDIQPADPKIGDQSIDHRG